MALKILTHVVCVKIMLLIYENIFKHWKHYRQYQSICSLSVHTFGKHVNTLSNNKLTLQMFVLHSVHVLDWSVSWLPMQILDFGLARSTDAEMTGYVVTRWYRAPEVILNWMHYTQTGKTIISVLHFISVLSWPVTFCCLSCENISTPVRGISFFKRWLVWYFMGQQFF